MTSPPQLPSSMAYPEIKRLYKYAAFNSRSISALVTGKLWYALPESFNDPFDCTVPNHALINLRQSQRALAKKRKAYAKHSAADEQSRDIGDRVRSIHQRFLSRESGRELVLAEDFVEGHKTLQSFLHTFGILSLSATPRSILMWSHYGSHHSGICLEFNRSPNDKLGTDAKPVIYSSQRESESVMQKHSHASPLFLKYSGWSYEKEWRLLENVGGRLYDFPSKLLSVICGARMPQQEIDAITSIVASLNSSRGTTIAVKVAEMNPTTYRMTVRLLPGH
jgi:Protein of unknown function (DUF2971)